MAGFLNAMVGSAFSSAAVPAYESIATVSVGAGGVGTVEFTGIPGTFKHLQIRTLARNTANSSGGSEENLRIRLNGDTASNYSTHWLVGDGSTLISGSELTTSMSQSYGIIPMSNAAASIFGVAVIDILDYQNTNKFKTLRALCGADKNGSGYSNFASSNWRNTNAITSILLFPEAGNFAQYSHFALYGIKG